MASTTYPADILNPEGSEVVQSGIVSFTSGTNTPAPTASPTFTGTVTLPAAVVGSALPTADPHVAGHLWANSGVVTVSAG